MNPLRFSSVLLSAVFLCPTVFAQTVAVAPESMGAIDSTAPAPPTPVHSLDLTAIDKTADPCADFYQ